MKNGRTSGLNASAKREIERQTRKARKRRDAAAILTVLSIVLFASPLISAIGSAESSNSVPVAVQYVFDIWALLIAAAFLMSRLMPGHEDTSMQSQGGEPPENTGRT